MRHNFKVCSIIVFVICISLMSMTAFAESSWGNDGHVYSNVKTRNGEDGDITEMSDVYLGESWGRDGHVYSNVKARNGDDGDGEWTTKDIGESSCGSDEHVKNNAKERNAEDKNSENVTADIQEPPRGRDGHVESNIKARKGENRDQKNSIEEPSKESFEDEHPNNDDENQKKRNQADLPDEVPCGRDRHVESNVKNRNGEE